MSSLFALPFIPALGPTGLPAGGATLTFYQTGTTTLVTIYADTALTTALPNPLTADAYGRFAQVYLNSSVVYRVVLKSALGTVIGDVDPYTPSVGRSANTFTGRQSAPGFDTVVASGNAANQISGPAGSYRYDAAQTSGLNRWAWGADDAAESGSNAGSNYFLARYGDNGVEIDRPIKINRSTGRVFFQGSGSVNVMDYGAKGDSTGAGSTGTDDTNAIKAAIASGARVIRIPGDTGGKFRLTSRIQPNLIPGAARSLRIEGDGYEGHAANTSPDSSLPGLGSWLYFDHTDEGLHLENSTGNEVYNLASIRNQPPNVNSGSVTASISGTTMTVTAVGSGKVSQNAVITGGTILAGTKIVQQLTGTSGGIGTYQVSRSQTVSSMTVTIGWVPNPNSWDFIFINGHFNVDNIFGWNATNFMATDYNGVGQFNAGYISCNAFAEGLRWDRQLGLPLRVGTFKLWPFNDFGGPQAQYAYQNLIGLHARHADGASVDAYFSIGAYIAMFFNGGSDGQPPRDTTSSSPTATFMAMRGWLWIRARRAGI